MDGNSFLCIDVIHDDNLFLIKKFFSLNIVMKALIMHCCL